MAFLLGCLTCNPEVPGSSSAQGPVSRKSRNLSGPLSIFLNVFSPITQ